MPDKPASDHRSGPTLAAPAMRVHVPSASEMVVDCVECGDHLVNGGDVNVDDRMGENHCGIGHMILVAGQVTVTASRVVLGEVYETGDPRVEQGRSHVRYLAWFQWSRLARVGTGCEAALYDPVGPVGGAWCRPGGEFKIEESHGGQSYPLTEPKSKMA